MFSNIGGKIKTLAQVVTWVGIIASVITGLILVSEDDDLILIGLLVMVAGSLTFWISSFLLYGFGELIVKTTEIAENTRDKSATSQVVQTQTTVHTKTDNDVEEKIELLNKWRAEGLITEEEYQNKMIEVRGDK